MGASGSTPNEQDAVQARWKTLVAQIACLDGVPTALVRDHRPNKHGRCAGCKLPQSGDQPWPCTLFALGAAATDMQAGRRPTPKPAAFGALVGRRPVPASASPQ